MLAPVATLTTCGHIVLWCRNLLATVTTCGHSGQLSALQADVTAREEVCSIQVGKAQCQREANGKLGGGCS